MTLIRITLTIALPVLTLCSAAWSHPPDGLSGPLALPDKPDGLRQLPSRVPPPKELRREQLNRFRSSTSAAIPQAQSSAATLTPALYSFVNINIPNSPYIQPNGVNDAGLVAGYYYDSDYNIHGFVWQNGVARTVDYPGSLDTLWNGVNNRGVLIGAFTDTTYYQHAVTYSMAQSAWTVLPDIPEYSLNIGYGINDDGSATGNAGGYPFGSLAWIWRPGARSYSYFTAPGSAEASTYPVGIAETGQVVGWAEALPNYGLGFLRASNVDEDSENQRFGYQNINVPGALSTLPNGINKTGAIAGWSFSATSTTGFIRTPGGVFTTVTYPGFDQTYIDGLNDRGVICGYSYSNTSGQNQAFVAYPR